jgi:peptidoglycan/LPS O-acetylase OafA/YrhL
MTALKREITDLTICRALFAAWVFTYHIDLHADFSAYLGPAACLIRRGYLGVDGFFLLSGFILARVHPEFSLSTTGAFRFWGKRLARIYPVHLAVLILLAAVAASGLALGIVPHDPGRFSLIALLQDLLLIQGWGVANQLAWNYPSWSISTEWAGYLLFPIFCAGAARLARMPAAMLLILCFLILAIVNHQFAHGLNLTFADSLWRFFPEFIAGTLTAKLVPTLAPQAQCRWLAGAGFGIIICGLLLHSDVSAVIGLWLLILSLAMQADKAGPPLFPNLVLLRFLGILSYAFYMSFATVELFLAQLYSHEGWNPANQKWAYALAMTLLTFALSLTLHHLIEKPARQSIDRWLQPNKPKKAAAF